MDKDVEVYLDEEVFKKLSNSDNTYNNFFSLDEDKSVMKLQSLIGKYIIFDVKTDTGKYERLPGLLKEVKENSLFIRKYDDGTEETKKLWTDVSPGDLFNDFEEWIPLEDILAIEENKNCNTDLKFEDKYIGKVCRITNKNDISINVIIKEFDGFDLWFDYKYLYDGNERMGENAYPFNFIKNISLI